MSPSRPQHPKHLALALALSLAAGSASAQSADAPNLGARSEVHDLYPASGPIVDRDVQTRNTSGQLTSERWRAGSTDFRQGGLAHAKHAWNNGTLVAGASALARSDGGHNGFAQAHMNTSFKIQVNLSGPDDGISNLLWTQILATGCVMFPGCVFDISFVHQTQGRLAYANSSGNREASFQERLTLRSATDTIHERTVGGSIALQLRNQQTTAQVSAGGDWSTSDLRPFDPTPASQLGLYPTGDARNAQDDPQGDLQGWNFFHSEVLTVPVRFIATEGFGSLNAWQFYGLVEVQLQQQATAGIGPFVYSSSTLSVDFADTSTFSFAQITDPAGIVDFSQARVALVAAPVPEPHAAWLALGGLALLWARRRIQVRPAAPALQAAG